MFHWQYRNNGKLNNGYVRSAKSDYGRDQMSRLRTEKLLAIRIIRIHYDINCFLLSVLRYERFSLEVIEDWTSLLI
jgi:hypothetical protein